MTSTQPLESPNSRVYLEYSFDDLPLHPGEGWTRFVCISDTHSKRFELPPGDVLLHSGDLSSGGSVRALKETIDWLRELDYGHKVIIAGNHDMCLDTAWREGGRLAEYWSVSPKEHDTARDLVLGEVSKACGIQYLQYDSTEIITGSRTWKVWGSPAAPVYSEGAFQYSNSSQAKAIYKNIPPDIDILLTHTPAYGILNQTRRGNEAGCRVLAKAMSTLTQCRLHLHGHIHESHGAVIVPANQTAGEKERVVVNGALQKFGMPVIVDLKH